MPFSRVPCAIWLAHCESRDAYGNEQVSYAEYPDLRTHCCYAPGSSKPKTADDIEDGRPHGARVSMTFYLPKTVDADLRDALIACYPSDDSTLSGSKFQIVGEPYSYPRSNVPGDYSWCVEGVAYLG